MGLLLRNEAASERWSFPLERFAHWDDEPFPVPSAQWDVSIRTGVPITKSFPGVPGRPIRCSLRCERVPCTIPRQRACKRGLRRHQAQEERAEDHIGLLATGSVLPAVSCQLCVRPQVHARIVDLPSLLRGRRPCSRVSCPFRRMSGGQEAGEEGDRRSKSGVPEGGQGA